MVEAGTEGPEERLKKWLPVAKGMSEGKVQ